MEREKYYVHLQKQEISKMDVAKEHALTIYATEGEVEELRELFIKLHSADFATFLRALVPIKPYRNAESNDTFDASYTEVAKMLYNLGDKEAKKFIRESGMIGTRPIDTAYTYPDPEHDGGKQA